MKAASHRSRCVYGISLTFTLTVLLAVTVTVQVRAQIDGNSLGAPMARYELQIYLPGVDPAPDIPFRTTVISASSMQCSQPRGAVTSPVSMNPTSVRWRDPSNAERDCVADVATFLRMLPPRSEPYLATLTVTDAGGTSRRSAASNIFFRTGFRAP